MGTLTRLELRTEVLKNLGDRPDDTEHQTRANRLLELAQVRIAREHDWEELRRLDTKSIIVTGTPATDKFISLTDVTLRKLHSLIRYVGSEQPIKLVELPSRQWAQLELSASASEEIQRDPTHYVHWAKGTVELYPIPNRNWTVQRRYTIWPTPFVDDNAVSDLDFKDDMLIALTTHNWFHSLGMAEDAALWFGISSDMLRNAIKDDERQPDKSFIPRSVKEGDLRSRDPVADPFVKEW